MLGDLGLRRSSRTSRVPLYVPGARTPESDPLVRVIANEALNIVLFSDADGIFWAFNSDSAALPDLHDFEESIPVGFEALAKAAPSA